jgi:ABC-type lipoprotein release transport system permease subunit
VVIGLGIIWIALATIQAGGSQVYSIVGMFVTLVFAVQGIRMSREPEARFPRFSLITSIVGVVLGVIALVLMGYAFTL